MTTGHQKVLPQHSTKRWIEMKNHTCTWKSSKKSKLQILFANWSHQLKREQEIQLSEDSFHGKPSTLAIQKLLWLELTDLYLMFPSKNEQWYIINTEWHHYLSKSFVSSEQLIYASNFTLFLPNSMQTKRTNKLWWKVKKTKTWKN